MLARRLIACLDVQGGRVVKGVRFGDLRPAGDPAALAASYSAAGIDEIVMLDVSATVEDRGTLLETVGAVARQTFIPLTVGGGISSLDIARSVLDAGADKVSLNSAALRDPSLITSLAKIYGSQAVVISIDAKSDGGRATPDDGRGTPDGGQVAPDGGRVPADGGRVAPDGGRVAPDGGRVFRPGKYQVFSRSGTARDARDVLTWAREAEQRGAGEILLTSIDRDGTRSGFDCDLTALVSTAVQIPVIASGGAGTPGHFAEVFDAGRADAALAASVFHFSVHGVRDLKTFLSARGVPMRLHW